LKISLDVSFSVASELGLEKPLVIAAVVIIAQLAMVGGQEQTEKEKITSFSNAHLLG
jgi:hypothetical protein